MKSYLIREEVLRGEAKEVVLDSDGVLNIGGRICVHKTGDLIRLILEGTIVLGIPSIWERQRCIMIRVSITGDIGMKRYITDFVSRCLTCQQVKLGGYDSIWVVVERLTKATHFIPVRVKYTAEKLAELYISQILRLHGVPVSILSD
ncbi:uncharacterized protein [Solanum lycopersicum]|uniref:uncharacterized protein n=1 Tax=Solanum lycopersicum TaxID=4081 RepID=UPI003748C6C9